MTRPTEDDVRDALGLAPLGHNQPPNDFDEKKAKALADAERYIENTNRWAKERETIADEEQAGAAQLQVNQLRDVKAELEALRTEEIEPYDLAIYAIRIVYKIPLQLVELSLGSLLGKLDLYLKAKRERELAEAAERQRLAEAARREAEEAARLAAQERTMQAQLGAEQATARAADLAKAAARQQAPTHVKGDYATRAMSFHSNWKARVVNEQAALRHYAKHPDVREAALKVITAIGTRLAKASKGKDEPPPGLEFWNDERVQ